MYTADEKKQLLANLDIEVTHRTRQFHSWLADCLENFKIHQEGHVLRIPKQVRSLTMKEFCTKYNGNVQLALRGVQKERLAALGAGEDFGEMDRSARKRKWVASQEAEVETSNDSEKRASKNARLMSSLKKKPGGSNTAQRSRLLATPGKRVSSTPSPQKQRQPFSTSTSGFSRPPSRPASPAKGTSTKPVPGAPRSRVPSSSTFNPVLPPKTPGYPQSTSHNPHSQSTLRLPRKDENMVMSLNGSPLANPFWDDVQSHSQQQQQPHRTLKRTQSSISIRRDPSFLSSQSQQEGTHSRSTSQASSSRSHSTTSTAHTQTSSHSRSNSEATLASPTDHEFEKLFSHKHSSDNQDHQDDHIHNSKPDKPPHLPTKTPRHNRTASTYSVTLSTQDGHLLEFDPLQTSPGELDRLEGISEEAKKHAKEEMARLVRAAMEKWKIG